MFITPHDRIVINPEDSHAAGGRWSAWSEPVSFEILYSVPGSGLEENARIWLPGVEAELIEYFGQDPSRLYSISPRQFEELIAAIFANQGFDVELTPQSRDGGFDVVAVQNSSLTGRSVYLVECKRYAQDHKVDFGIVQRLLGAVHAERATKGIIATTSFFTGPAMTFQRENEFSLSLADYDALCGWLADRQVDGNSR